MKDCLSEGSIDVHIYDGALRLNFLLWVVDKEMDLFKEKDIVILQKKKNTFEGEKETFAIIWLQLFHFMDDEIQLQ